MKAMIAGLVLAATLVAGSAEGAGSHYVRGYTRSNGTYVAPHYQTNPNGTSADNWSTVGNVNPYTGAAGTKPLYGNTAAAPAALYAPAPAVGPSAICRDGSPSYSQNRSGTCSHHGGVAQWR
jgi:hypothetical protein